ncbi:hypothetical protein RclHR1_13230002 [Rhizophagus clarus]|uniref:Uncharacterized protein n=1 Tax=Rhizophagus clarus TaxID=94130 RepID=A0A2Z6R241_9GLOM|nr:hypothetical protein RclHR1_13230002 [Rhizophagus clarus]
MNDKKVTPAPLETNDVLRGRRPSNGLQYLLQPANRTGESVIILPGSTTSAAGSISPTTSPADSISPTGSVASVFSSPMSFASSISSEGPTSPAGHITLLHNNCGDVIDDAAISLIVQSSYNSVFRDEHPKYFSREMELASIFKGDSNFGTFDSTGVLKGEVEEYLEILKLG